MHRRGGIAFLFTWKYVLYDTQTDRLVALSWKRK